MSFRPGVFVSPAALGLLTVACTKLCDNENVAVVFAPGHSARAIVFHRDCGATTGISTQVSIL